MSIPIETVKKEDNSASSSNVEGEGKMITGTDEEPEKEKAFDAVFNKSMIYKGGLWFGLITIASVAVIFFYNHTGDTFTALS